jgi:hypothetical protein
MKSAKSKGDNNLNTVDEDNNDSVKINAMIRRRIHVTLAEGQAENWRLQEMATRHGLSFIG